MIWRLLSQHDACEEGKELKGQTSSWRDTIVRNKPLQSLFRNEPRLELTKPIETSQVSGFIFTARKTKLREGNVFTGVCQSFCRQGRVGISSLRSILGGAYVQGVCRGWVCPEGGYLPPRHGPSPQLHGPLAHDHLIWPLGHLIGHSTGPDWPSKIL